MGNILSALWNWVQSAFLFVCCTLIGWVYVYTGLCIGASHQWWIIGHDWFLTNIFNQIPWYSEAILFFLLPFLVCVFVGILVFALGSIIIAPFKR